MYNLCIILQYIHLFHSVENTEASEVDTKVVDETPESEPVVAVSTEEPVSEPVAPEETPVENGSSKEAAEKEAEPEASKFN